MVAGGDLDGHNSSTTNLNNSQSTGGLLVVGDTAQSNAQQTTTDQDVDQANPSSALVLFGGSQRAANNQSTNVDNCQEIGFGAFCFF